MNKSNYFFGQSVFGQLISFLDLNKIKKISKKHMGDHYVKKFDTSDHLISMLFSTFAPHSGSSSINARFERKNESF